MERNIRKMGKSSHVNSNTTDTKNNAIVDSTRIQASSLRLAEYKASGWIRRNPEKTRSILKKIDGEC